MLSKFVTAVFDFVVITFDFIASFVMFMPNLIRVLTSFLAPDVPGAFYFNEANVMLFLDCFKLLDENYYVSDLKLVRKLSDYCESEIQKEIRALAEYDQQDWSQI